MQENENNSVLENYWIDIQIYIFTLKVSQFDMLGSMYYLWFVCFRLGPKLRCSCPDLGNPGYATGISSSILTPSTDFLFCVSRSGLKIVELSGGSGSEDSTPWRLVSLHTTVDSSSHLIHVCTPATLPPLRTIIGRPSYLPPRAGLTMGWTRQPNTSLPPCTHRPPCSRIRRVRRPVTWRQIWIWTFRVRRGWVRDNPGVLERPVGTRAPGAQPAATCTTWTSLWTVWPLSDTKPSTTRPPQPSCTLLPPQLHQNIPPSQPVSTRTPRPRVACSPRRLEDWRI